MGTRGARGTHGARSTASMPTAQPSATILRYHISVQGIVQGVGFRPFVYALALRFGLCGFVLNSSAGVEIEVEGSEGALEAFRRSVVEESPPLSRIDAVTCEVVKPRGDAEFTILPSRTDLQKRTMVSPDTATCDDCLREVFDPSDRRYRYPFTNCTNCGPRFTIVQDVPYDRASTTMHTFTMCPQCQAEYDNPLDRRFHAQPNACPVCGPTVRLLDQAGKDVGAEDPITAAALHLAGGAILAIKGLGGYHLSCDATDSETVARLRARKHREAKPFALMVPDVEIARRLCHVSEAEATILQSRRRPIVLLECSTNSFTEPALTSALPAIAAGVAPGVTTLGVMLPYTPLHHLLLSAFAEVCEPGHLPALVMTSGNRSDEPIAYRDADAQFRLASIADGTLTHNRDIQIRCDDTLMRIAAGGEQVLRRSRGYAPEPLILSRECSVPLLACGSHLKNTFTLLKGKQAFVSHHIGDLDNLETLESFREGIAHYGRLFDIHPQAVAYDLHPEYLATKYALELDVEHKIGVQHHHAHIASVLVEHRIEGPVIGVAADGTGYGTDGAIWGCEIMVADLLTFTRRAHLAYVPLPGGDRAIQQPWRMAAVYLERAYGQEFEKLDLPFVRRLDQAKWRPVRQMAARGLNSPPTSSLGRLFDAVAALLGVRDEALYEGQAAIELETLGLSATPASLESRRFSDAHIYPFSVAASLARDSPSIFAVEPMIRAIVEDVQAGTPRSMVAARFHRSIAEFLASGCLRIRDETGLEVVTLSGGVFQNRLLLERLTARLEELGFRVYVNRRVPPNDGGLSLGQVAVAAARIERDLAG